MHCFLSALERRRAARGGVSQWPPWRPLEEKSLKESLEDSLKQLIDEKLLEQLIDEKLLEQVHGELLEEESLQKLLDAR